MSHVIAVLGATESVAYELFNLLDERRFPVKKIYALSSEQSAGQNVSFGDRTLPVENAESFDFKAAGVTVVFSCGTVRETKSVLPKAAKSGALCIDLTPTYRMDPDVPLFIPEVNPGADAGMKKNIIAAPCSVAAMCALVLKPLHAVSPIRRVVLSTYQSTGECGRTAQDELFNQTKALFMNASREPHEFPKQIAFNIIPVTDEFMDDGSTREEWMIITEIKKMISTSVRISASCVRVPTFVGHSVSMNIEFENELSPIEASKILSLSPGLGVPEDPEEFVTPLETAGEDLIFVSRIRSDISVNHGLSLWIAGDNLRKATALNAVHIAEYRISEKK